MSLQLCTAIESVTNFDLMSALYRSEIATGLKLLSSAFSVLVALSNHYNNQTGVVFPSINLLCRRLNMSKPTVINAIKTLVEKRLIIKSKSKGHSVYSFTNVLFEYLKAETQKTRNITAPKTNKANSTNGVKNFTSKSKEFSNKQDNPDKIKNNNVKNFKNYNVADQPKGIQYQSCKNQVEKIQQDKTQSVSPLEMSKEDQIAFYNNLPEFLKVNSSFAKTIRERHNL